MEMIECKWCNDKNPYRGPVDYFGFSGYTCQGCGRSVDESYRDWILREEWANGSYHVKFASGIGRRSGSVPESEMPIKVFSRSADEALKNYPHVVMYPDSGGYTGIYISPSEARFVVFGSLFKHIAPVKNVAEVFLAWRPVMDEVLRRYKALRQDESRCGIHIDEIVDADMKERIKILVGENV